MQEEQCPDEWEYEDNHKQEDSELSFGEEKPINKIVLDILLRNKGRC